MYSRKDAVTEWRNDMIDETTMIPLGQLEFRLHGLAAFAREALG